MGNSILLSEFPFDVCVLGLSTHLGAFADLLIKLKKYNRNHFILLSRILRVEYFLSLKLQEMQLYN